MTPDYVRDRITHLRLQKGVSEYQMSYDLGHSRGYINNITSGKTLPSMTEFFAICDYFEITPMQFFCEDHENPRALQAVADGIDKLNAADLELLQAFVVRLLA